MLTVDVDFSDGPIIFCLHTEEQIPAAGWEEYLRITQEWGVKQPAGKPFRGIVCTDGASPGPTQRAEFSKMMGEFNRKISTRSSRI